MNLRHRSVIINLILDFLRIDVNTTTPKGNTVCFSVAFLAIGILGFILFGGFTVFMLFQKIEMRYIWAFVLIIILNLLPISIIIAYINCRIHYNDKGFTHKNFFGIKREYTYDQITGIIYAANESFLYIGEKRIMLDELQVGGKEFIFFVKKQYHKIYKNEIPKIKPKKDIFKGNLKSPTGFLLIYGLLILLAIMVTTITSFSVFYPSSESDTEQLQVNFSSCNKVDGELVMKTTDNNYFHLRYSDEPYDKLLTICSGNKLVTVYCDKINPKHGDDYYLIKAVKYNDEFVLSFDDTNRIQRQMLWPIMFVAVIIDAVVIWFIVFTIMIARNPQKYKKKTVQLFFKDGYLEY